MAVALRLQTLDIPAQQRQRVDELRVTIRAEQRAVDAAQGTERAAALEKLIALRQELLGVVKSASAAETKSDAVLAQARALAAGGAVLVPVVTNIGAKILIVTGPKDGNGITVLGLAELTAKKLDVLMRGERKNERTGGWLGAYNINYLAPAEKRRRWPEWLTAVGNLGPDLWRLLGGQLDAALRAQGVKTGARLVWLPSGALGILPLGLAQDSASGRRLSNDYEIVYAPSLEALAAVQAHIAKAAPPTLAAVINPTGDLPGTEKEGAIVASHFAKEARTLLERRAAEPEAVLAALKGRTHWHFASHGTFSWADARQSALVMRDRAPLSVGRLLETDGLGRPRLVVLSACETGLYDIGNNPDEFIGLPGAFMALGAAGVLATLWPVSDAATALLIAKFYELYIGASLTPPSALHQAQAWLRDATNDDLSGYAKVAAGQGRLKTRHLAEIQKDLSAEGLRHSRNSAFVEWLLQEKKPASQPAPTTQLARPYAHPYFWAGFIHTGL
jgi:CHAT domain-containing protein